MQENKDIDLTVVTNSLITDGIGRQGIGLIKTLYDSLKVNAWQLPPNNYKDVPKEVVDIFTKPFSGFGRVTFWTYILGLNEQMISAHQASKSPVKIAYSMFESSAIPKLWTNILNTYYDMVVVPDPYLVNVYKNAGVKIPIFVIPLGIMVENLIARPMKTTVNDPFTFGMSAGFWNRKNHIKLMEAFGKKFGNDPKFKLRLHGRFGSYKTEVEKAVKQANYSNVELLNAPLGMQEYDDFMDSIDCYVFPSMGEGFSITPRETMALGKPCILTNNSSHKTICNSGFVIPLPSEDRIPAIYEVFGNQQIGFYNDCDINELATLMKDVVDNYDKHLEKAKGGREWVKQYLWSSLKSTYINLIKPQKITLGKMNKITSTAFQTNDKKLYWRLRQTFESGDIG